MQGIQMSKKWQLFFSKVAKKALFMTPFRRYFYYRYQYAFSPAQLCFLCSCIENTRDIPGAIVEIGCAAGCTTVFLNKYMESSGIKKIYYCIDTFAGFTSIDMEYEVSIRGKKYGDFTGFSNNSKEYFDFAMKANNIQMVKSIQADVNKFDFTSIGEISFCLIDVDLYLPVKTSLNGVNIQMKKGGIIVIDDCRGNNVFDGALQAYREFISGYNVEENIILDKIGVINIA